MIYQGENLSVSIREEDHIAQLEFNAKGSVNVFNQATIKELDEATEALLDRCDDIRGLILTSAKDAFVVGADITEFTGLFAQDEATITEWVATANRIFNKIEDMPFPTASAINGLALGGGFEVVLTTDFRVMAQSAKVGLPETQLGIFPGFGGTVRMSRLIGVDNAVEWIAAGKHQKAAKALADHAVDAVVNDGDVIDAAIDMIKLANEGKVNHLARREQKKNPLLLNKTEAAMAFKTCMAGVYAKAGKNYPAPVAAVKAMEDHAFMTRDEALKVEAAGFAKVAKTPQAQALVGVFLNDQHVKKVTGKWAKQAKPVAQAAVLGAGTMGGGIAYQSAVKGTPIIMKDIADGALDVGMEEASKLLAKMVERGRMKPLDMGKTLSKIRPTLNYGDFANVDIVVEAVVEKLNIKQSVLKEVEGICKDGTILTSNTSTISITEMAKALDKPENFAGMHFFNPVHKMPLVEVIRGEKTSDEAIATVVAYSKAMGKTPIVVNDCPGFFVNRVLFPYFGGFDLLLRDGGDMFQIDKVMEKFGWPMGPAYLSDVVGIDVCVHAAEVMKEGFPDRIAIDDQSANKIMYKEERLGQKNKQGFYDYGFDRKGRLAKNKSETAIALLTAAYGESKAFDEQEIIDRMMVPMINEVARCLEEGIVDSAAEADMALLMGIGFPPFKGGICRYLDATGIQNHLDNCEKYAALGNMYKAPQLLIDMAKDGKTFY